jgi:hypothetical protein
MREVVDNDPINQEIQILQKSDKAWKQYNLKKTHVASRLLCLFPQSDWRKKMKIF